MPAWDSAEGELSGFNKPIHAGGGFLGSPLKSASLAIIPQPPTAKAVARLSL